MFQTKFSEEVNTFYVRKYFSENRALYEILRKNMVQSDRSQITI